MYQNKECDAIPAFENQERDVVIPGEQIEEHVAIYEKIHSQDTPKGICNIDLYKQYFIQ